jgi:hypothetical protein
MEQSGLRTSSFVTIGLCSKMDEILDEVDGLLDERFQDLRYRALFVF